MLLRVVVLLVALALGSVFACSNTSSATSTGAYDAGGNTHCDGQGGCGDQVKGCTSCAENGPCLDEANACATTSDCHDYSVCLAPCLPGDDTCVTQCENLHPEGAQVYDTLLVCVYCTACKNSCASIDVGCTN